MCEDKNKEKNKNDEKEPIAGIITEQGDLGLGYDELDENTKEKINKDK